MRRALLATLLLVAPTVLHAQTTTVPTRSGVLLAIEDCRDGDVCGSPTTYWIVREGDRVRIAAKGNGLLVPRRDGFWWLGAAGGTNRFQVSDGGEMAACDTTQTADTASAMTNDPDALDDPLAEDTPGVIWARRASAPRDTTQYELTTWSNEATWLDWITGDWIAYSGRSIDNREHIHQSHAVVTFDALARPSPDGVPGFVPDSAAWERAARACLRRTFGAEADAFLSDPDVLGPWGYSYWTVRRDRTRWRVAHVYYPNYAYDDVLASCDVPVELTASMMGHDRVTISWSAIKNVLPEADAAFESPSGDLLLVQADTVWHAFIPRDGSMGTAVASFQLGWRPVMAQWAVGAHAARWTREVGELLRQGSPPYRPKPSGRDGG